MEASNEAPKGGESRFSGTHWLCREDDGRVSCRLTWSAFTPTGRCASAPRAFCPAVTTAQLTGEHGKKDPYFIRFD